MRKSLANRSGRPPEFLKRQLAMQFIGIKQFVPEKRLAGVKGSWPKGHPSRGYLAEGAKWIDDQLVAMKWSRQYRIGHTRFVLQKVIEEMRDKPLPKTDPAYSEIGQSLKCLIMAMGSEEIQNKEKTKSFNPR